jgi:hypothetical protein
MGHRKKTSKRAKTILRLPDLEQSKNAVLNSLAAASSQESYGHAIDEFIGWYCSEPRLAFNRSVVLRYRFFLEQKNLAPSTINVRLAAVRRLAHEAADTGFLSPELAAGIGRVKGAKRLGVRIGNWLTVEQSKTLLAEADKRVRRLGRCFQTAQIGSSPKPAFQARRRTTQLSNGMNASRSATASVLQNRSSGAIGSFIFKGGNCS